MADEGVETSQEGSVKSPTDSAPGKDYSIGRPSPEALVVEMAHWERLRGRVRELEEQPSIAWLPTGAWTVFTICVSAVLAVLVLPEQGTQFGSGVEFALWAIAISAFLLALVLTGVYFWAKETRAATASDIDEEMGVIDGSWRGSQEGKSDGS